MKCTRILSQYYYAFDVKLYMYNICTRGFIIPLDNYIHMYYSRFSTHTNMIVNRMFNVVYT